jgi:hypothetical protein
MHSYARWVQERVQNRGVGQDSESPYATPDQRVRERRETY